MSENHSLLPRIENNRDDESSYDELSDNSSCESYYSDSESSVPEWESSLDSSGYLLFIDCHPFTKQSNPTEPKEDNFVKDKLRQSTRSKFLKLLRRRDSKRRSKRYRSQDTSQDSSSASKVTFQDYEYGEVKVVNVFLNHDGRTAFGRRSTLIENLLGISISPFPNTNRVMVAGLDKHDKIKIGDWLKMIENIEVNVNNINNVLEQFSNNESVLLHLQRVAAVEINQSFLNDKQSKLVYNLLNFNEELIENLWNLPIGILYINTNNLSESDSEYQDVVYVFPKPFKQNPLCQTRGLFITLNHLLSDITKSKPQITSFLYKNNLAHVVYQTYDQNVLLFMLPDRNTSKEEIKLIQLQIIRNLEFTFGSIDECFTNEGNYKRLDHFFSLFFQKTLEIGVWSGDEKVNHYFESVLNGAAFMSLPNEVQMQIDDALTEMEASDYRDWNEEPLDCQRLFTILGSALYHDGYLLASHFIHEDLLDIHAYCRLQNFFNLLDVESVRSLIHWREVFPSSTRKRTSKKILDERCYILVIGNNKDLLVVIMEAGGCTEPPEENMGPDAFYVEEVEATLSHIQELGVQQFAERWLKKNTCNFSNDDNKKTDLFSRIKPQKKIEVTSILKRRSSDLGLSQAGSVFSLQEDDFSEDSVSQEAYSERSELSDEPVVGRRAIRERRTNFYDDDSDVDDYREGSQLSTGSYDLSELRQALLNETECIQPVHIGVGDINVLYHYVQFDEVEGVLLMLPKESSDFIDEVMNNFRCCCQKIRKLFQNTLRFKNMSTQDMAKSLINKTLIAIKEHGTLFECINENSNVKKSSKSTYWVIGRLFYMPYPKELYVCYQDTIPQNLVDMAFKLGMM